jgi:hypothetical protein
MPTPPRIPGPLNLVTPRVRIPPSTVVRPRASPRARPGAPPRAGASHASPSSSSSSSSTSAKGSARTLSPDPALATTV